MINKILSFLFPPKLPKVDYWEGTHEEFHEQGRVGPVKPKQYRDGIERHFAESQHLGS